MYCTFQTYNPKERRQILMFKHFTWFTCNSTLRAESPSIFLDKSGRGRRLCERLQDFLLSMLQRKCNRASINLLVKVCYHRFPWYATFENKTPAETFPKFPSIIHVIDRSDRNSPITARLAWRKEGVKVILVAVIGGFRSDLSITRKTDGNFGNVSAGVLFSKVAYQGKRW